MLERGVALTNVLMVAAEAAPFAKVGGMADVVGSLPAALKPFNVDARVLMPGYGFIPHQKYNINPLFSFQFHHRQGTSDIHLYFTQHDGVTYYFFQAWPYFGTESQVYHDYTWDLPRFVFFNQVAMAVIWELRQRLGWHIDVVHTHDWHTGLLAFLLENESGNRDWAGIATVHTIHNMMYQGNWAGWAMYQAGIPERNHGHLIYQDLTDNLMGIGLAYSTLINTVSPRYAIEIQYPYQGYGLDGLLRTRLGDLWGILNGIDNAMWDPATDPALHTNYDVSNFRERRVENKIHLQRMLNLPERPDVPMIGIVSRLVWQKGIDMLVPTLYRLLQDYDVQFVALGTGEPKFEHELGHFGYEMRDRGARVMLGYDAGLAQHIYAGADLFAMPSHFEPCGISQMIAMRYGSLPIVRETGGLADTVDNYDNGDGDQGTGFVFSWQQPDALYNTFCWAVETYLQRRSVFERLQERAMQRNFSWERSAEEYTRFYQHAMAKKHGY